MLQRFLTSPPSYRNRWVLLRTRGLTVRVMLTAGDGILPDSRLFITGVPTVHTMQNWFNQAWKHGRVRVFLFERLNLFDCVQVLDRLCVSAFWESLLYWWNDFLCGRFYTGAQYVFSTLCLCVCPSLVPILLILFRWTFSFPIRNPFCKDSCMLYQYFIVTYIPLYVCSVASNVCTWVWAAQAVGWRPYQFLPSREEAHKFLSSLKSRASRR